MVGSFTNGRGIKTKAWSRFNTRMHLLTSGPVCSNWIEVLSNRRKVQLSI